MGKPKVEKLTKFVKKNDESGKSYISCGLRGDWSGKRVRDLKTYLNHCTEEFLSPKEDQKVTE